ncbi:AraC family transcriptional regulator [Agrobacterium cavarae]|uniref:AraC family transcriptional regulator n=1 Tax=Agrobacterium cavarae TaxID=2528239 RepID=A0ABY1YD60_9HYPH|nr:helix-turn-helix domain-containing protein [Agrobacterium cavarae]TBN14859.1 AraC family transcriptional regulator [Agrobacterium cavarae]
MPTNFRFISPSIEPFEQYINKAYGPARVSALAKPAEMGRSGKLFSNDHLSVEWAQMIGSHRIEPLSELDGIIFNRPVLKGSVHRFKSRSFDVEPGFALAYRDLKSVDIFDQSYHTSAFIPWLSLRKRLSVLMDDEISFALNFETTPVSTRSIGALSNLLDAIKDQEIIDIAVRSDRTTSFSDFIIDAFLLNYPNNFSCKLLAGPPALAPRQVKRAIDFMHAHPGRALTVELIAREAGASVRALQSAFQEFTGLTPMAYFRTLRLKGARASLLCAADGDTVAAIANQWGFFHHGRFSKLYREAFGEAPTDTLRNTEYRDSEN